MYHLVARVPPGARAWTRWAEGVALFARLTRGCPGLAAAVVMPDHVHLLHPLDVRELLAQVLAGHTRARRRVDRGAPGFLPLPPAERLADDAKRRRSVRYVHLNPVRAGLCADPLAWPLSTHRDSVDLAIPAVVAPRLDPDRFHAYVSSDPSVRPEGTALPRGAASGAPLARVLAAVSALTRAPLDQLRARGAPRTLFLAAAREICGVSPVDVGAVVGVDRRTVHRSEALPQEIAKVRRVLGDPRFFALRGEDGPRRG